MTKAPTPLPTRILLVLPEVFNCVGGIQMFGRALCLAAGKWAESNNGSVSALVLNDQGAPDARYVPNGYVSYAGFGKNKTKLVTQFVRQILAQKYDWIIFGHVSLAPLALMARTIRPGAKTCVITYGLEVWQPLPQLQRKALAYADLLLAISEHTKNQVVMNAGIPVDKITLFPCALDPFWEIPEPGPTTEAGPPVILSVTRMNKEDGYKGIDNVIRSLPSIVRETGLVDYRIVGQGDDVPRLRELAAELGVAPYITFLGEISHDELREQYRSCSVFVMPSSREGFGIVFLEAMAYGKPVVGGNHGGTPSVVSDGETGLLVDSSDVDGIARSITRLLSDAGLREQFGSAGRERLLSEFTFERFERNFASLLG